MRQYRAGQHLEERRLTLKEKSSSTKVERALPSLPAHSLHPSSLAHAVRRDSDQRIPSNEISQGYRLRERGDEPLGREQKREEDGELGGEGEGGGGDDLEGGSRQRRSSIVSSWPFSIR